MRELLFRSAWSTGVLGVRDRLGPSIWGPMLFSAGIGRTCDLQKRVPPPTQYWIKIVHMWVQLFYLVLGLGSGGIVLGHFQTQLFTG